MARIGFVGLEGMGFAMAIHLLKAGHVVTGFDLNPTVLKDFTAEGGISTNILTDTALNQEFIFTMLSTADQVKQVCLGPKGLYAAARNAIHIDCSTIDVLSAKLLAKEAMAANLLAVDAPVAGGLRGAQAACLVFMVGGQQFAFEHVQPILLAMGQAAIHAGDSGSGQAAKICNNMILGITMIAVSEAFVLAQKLGLSLAKLHYILTHSTGQCWVLKYVPPAPDLVELAPANDNFQAAFKAESMLKDLNLSQKTAGEVGAYTPLAEHARAIYQRFIDEGHGELDYSAIIKALTNETI